MGKCIDFKKLKDRDSLLKGADKLIGDMFLSAGSVSYVGPFTGVYRERIVSYWLNKCSTNQIPFTGMQERTDGADCSAKTPWFGVRALFGYYRVPIVDSNITTTSTPTTFERCLFPGACLGARNLEFAKMVKYHAVIAVSIHFPKIQLLLLVKRAQLDIRL